MAAAVKLQRNKLPDSSKAKASSSQLNVGCEIWDSTRKSDIDFLTPELGPDWAKIEAKFAKLSPKEIWALKIASHVLDCILNNIREDWKKLILDDEPIHDENAISTVGQLQQGEFWRRGPNSILAPITWFDDPREMYIKFAYYPTKAEEVLPKRPPLPVRKKRQYAEYLKEIKSIVQTVAPIKAEAKPKLLREDEEVHSFEERLMSVSKGLPVEKTKASLEARKKPEVVIIQEPVIKVAPAGEKVDAQKREVKSSANTEDEISADLKNQRWKVVDKKVEKKVVKKKVVSVFAPTLKKMELKIKPKEAPGKSGDSTPEVEKSGGLKQSAEKGAKNVEDGPIASKPVLGKGAFMPVEQTAKNAPMPKKSYAKTAPGKVAPKLASKTTLAK